MKVLPIGEFSGVGFSVYEGTCGRCGVTVQMKVSVVPLVVPPPTLALAHRCEIPVTGFVATYIGHTL